MRITRKAFALAGLVAVAGFVLTMESDRSGLVTERARASTRPTVQTDDAGITFRWDRERFRGSTGLELIVASAGESTVHRLAGESGTMVIAPRPGHISLKLRVHGGQQDGQIVEVFRSTPERPVFVAPEVADSTAPQLEGGGKKLAFVMNVEGRSRPVVARASVSFPRLPAALRRELAPAHLDVDLFIKVSPDGSVASAATRYFDEPVRKRLALMASDAVMKWRFDSAPVEGGQYRDTKVTLRFAKDRVTLARNQT